MKKRTLGVLVLSAAFGLLCVGCGSKGTEDIKNTQTEVVQQSEEVKSTEVVTEAITESTEVQEVQEQTESEEREQIEVQQAEVSQSSDTQGDDSAGESQSTDSQPAAPRNDDGGSNNAGNTASEELPSNPYPLNTLVEDTGSNISFYVLETFTNGVSNGAPDFLDMTHKAYDYILGIGKEPNDVKFICAYGPYKEGCAWKYTVYYN